MSYPLLRYAKTLRLLYVFVMKAQLKTILISSIFMLFSIVSYAQDNIDPPPPPAPPLNGLPIDQNILWLLIVGLIYGAYSICFSSKNK
ncbi:hypothetical protein N9R53_07185 [Flavobacteriaceae bacterium]|nr:hypothetical protein [Flavobacteriaceae bacterium]MDC1051683.1 hypothetical protein [Flavobacteriaceae bacterium]